MHQLITNLVIVKVWMANRRVKTSSSLKYSPHIFNGASSSNSMGCDRKISLDLRHRPLISPSDSWTFLPGLAPRTVEQLHNNCYKRDRHRSQGLTEIDTQWRKRTAEPRSRHGLPSKSLDIMLSMFNLSLSVIFSACAAYGSWLLSCRRPWSWW